ncbi:hypothetical protein [uncultured Roseovarius sp.]|uniref:hypothetical protein n=1 Tax=uncultured Roseovarius sp. TaxID=293344 RepID=UPI0025D833B1|nr:hypothetical protein [uncultured Roseovarius sp.]
MPSPPDPPADQAPRDPDAAVVGPILLVVVIFLVLWGGSIALWGIPGLYMPAVIMVPVIWAGLLLISRG